MSKYSRLTARRMSITLHSPFCIYFGMGNIGLNSVYLSRYLYKKYYQLLLLPIIWIKLTMVIFDMFLT